MNKIHNITLFSALLVAVFAVASVVASVLAVHHVTYINKTVRNGSAYGFTIGDSKDSVYKKARILYNGKKAYILHPLGPHDFGPMFRFHFTDDEYHILYPRTVWGIYFKKDFMSSIHLTFQNDSLIEIYRQRALLEFP